MLQQPFMCVFLLFIFILKSIKISTTLRFRYWNPILLTASADFSLSEIFSYPGGSGRGMDHIDRPQHVWNTPRGGATVKKKN
jgi:hypothetical protein